MATTQEILHDLNTTNCDAWTPDGKLPEELPGDDLHCCEDRVSAAWNHVVATRFERDVLARLEAKRAGTEPAWAEWLDVERTWPAGEPHRPQAVIWTTTGARLRWSGAAGAWIDAVQS